MALKLSAERQHAGALDEHLCAFRYVYATCSNSAPHCGERRRGSLGYTRLCVPPYRRSSGGLFNFLVGAAFHSTALKSGPFLSKVRRNSSPLPVIHRSSDEADCHAVRNSLTFSFFCWITNNPDNIGSLQIRRASNSPHKSGL